MQCSKVVLEKAWTRLWISACGHCQNGNCDNMTNDPVIEDDDEDVSIVLEDA